MSLTDRSPRLPRRMAPTVARAACMVVRNANSVAVRSRRVRGAVIWPPPRFRRRRHGETGDNLGFCLGCQSRFAVTGLPVQVSLPLPVSVLMMAQPLLVGTVALKVKLATAPEARAATVNTVVDVPGPGPGLVVWPANKPISVALNARW